MNRQAPSHWLGKSLGDLVPLGTGNREVGTPLVIRSVPNKDSTPLKPSIRNREESKFSSGDLQHIDSSASKLSTLSSGSGSKLSTLSSSPHHHRPNSADIEQAKRGVHFQRTFAVKTILTSRINKDQLDELVNEIMIMRKLVREY